MLKSPTYTRSSDCLIPEDKISEERVRVGEYPESNVG